jgi:hypothetical protein
MEKDFARLLQESFPERIFRANASLSGSPNSPLELTVVINKRRFSLVFCDRESREKHTDTRDEFFFSGPREEKAKMNNFLRAESAFPLSEQKKMKIQAIIISSLS